MACRNGVGNVWIALKGAEKQLERGYALKTGASLLENLVGPAKLGSCVTELTTCNSVSLICHLRVMSKKDLCKSLLASIEIFLCWIHTSIFFPELAICSDTELWYIGLSNVFLKEKYLSYEQITAFSFWQCLLTESILKKVLCFIQVWLQVSRHKFRDSEQQVAEPICLKQRNMTSVIKFIFKKHLSCLPFLVVKNCLHGLANMFTKTLRDLCSYGSHLCFPLSDAFLLHCCL